MEQNAVGFLLLLALVLGIQHGSHAQNRGCARVDAVTYQNGSRIFISGFTVVPFNPINRKQVDVTKPIRDWYPEVGYKYKIDAAYHPKKDPQTTILISRDKYFHYDKDCKLISGPSSLSEIFPKSAVWASGVDAAANYNGHEFFFKGCTMLVKFKAGAIKPFNLKTMGIPCDVDAALFNGRSLAVMKESKVYLVREIKGTFRRIKSVCYAKYYTTDFPLCGC